MIYNVQLLRFLSAMGVFIAHLVLWGNRKYGLDMAWMDPYAYYLMSGVDIFFIISGFVMVLTASHADTNITDFKKRAIRFLFKRASRIYPMWWLLCLLLLPIFLYNPALINSDPNNQISFIKSFFLVPNTAEPILAVGWTLEYEMIFYLCFALTLFLSRRNQFFVLAGVFSACFMGLSFVPINPENALYKIMTSSLIFYFIIGMGFGLIYERIKFSKPVLIGLLCAVAASIVHMFHYEFKEIDRVLHFGPFAVSVFMVFLYLEKGGMIRSKKMYQFGGDISYALYLVHLIVIAVVGRTYMALGLNAFIPPVLLLFIMMCGGIIAAILLFHFFEKPTLNLLRHKK